MAEVEVVDADNEGGLRLALLEGLGEGADEGRLAYALDAVEAYDEGLGMRRAGLVGLEAL